MRSTGRALIKVLAVGPCSSADAPDGSSLGNNLLYLDLPSDLPGSDARRRVAIERFKPCDNPHDSSNMPKYLPAGLTRYVLNTFSKNPLRTTSLKTTFRRPLNDSKWRRSPFTSGSGGEVESSRCYTRRIRWDSPNRTGSGKWTSNSLAPTFCVIGPALRTSTAKPSAFTAGCGLARPTVSFPGTTVTVFGRQATLASHARNVFGATATQCSPREPTFGTRATMGYRGLEKSARLRLRMGYTGSAFCTTRGRSSFFSLQRATRPQQGPYEVLGAFRST